MSANFPPLFQQAREESVAEFRKNVARNMISRGESNIYIWKQTDLPIETIEALRKETA